MFLSSCRTSSMATIAVFAHRFNTRQRKRQMDRHLAMLVTEGLVHCRCRVAWKGGTRSLCSVPAVRGASHILLSHLLLALSHLLHNYRGGGTLQSGHRVLLVFHSFQSSTFKYFIFPLSRSFDKKFVNIQSQNLTLRRMNSRAALTQSSDFISQGTIELAN